MFSNFLQLATRIKKYLPNIIDSDQTVFVKKKDISEKIPKQLQILLKYTNIKNIPGLILLVDFERVFDTVEWILYKY